MSGRILRYFAGGNTAKGFYSLYDSNLAHLERVLLLTGRSQTEKTELIERLLEKWEDDTVSVEIIHRASHPDQIEGFIIREKGFAIVDADPPRRIGKEYVGPQWETIDLEQADRASQWVDIQKEIDLLQGKIKEQYEKAYKAYARALRIHDDWEGIYIGKMDFAKADRVTEELLSNLFQETENQTRKGTILRRFLGAATPVGAVDFVDNITEDLQARFFLKGRAGTGKSTLLKKIVTEAERRGYDLEVYHCGFDPGSLDMVVVRELGWTVFDSTAPHEYFPDRPGDSVIDMYELAVAPGTDEAFAEEIAHIEAKYREQMKLGKIHLAEAQKFQDQLETLYMDNSKHNPSNPIYHELEKLIDEYMK
ncbi:hypothetical protein MUB24_11670 [Lederbergia sp. NSJ-179]|uniref:hypothetical protein n=1 Tax=Lederbergia sp. NSJ-179 TaxID=2931402 RepID=UPI001FD3A946|nr:hypothetical protein [Lederbergia sp. NSJ-179]MCJ7841540.1 hypothetical protein [Lederbergia sp. NSJ-179]